MNELPGFVVVISGTYIAWFQDKDQAAEWARDNYFGQWLLHEYSIPVKPLFTPEEIEAAKKEAQKLYEALNWE
jgi:hypothetical protein